MLTVLYVVQSIEWVASHDLVMFDMDGLLVDTECLHLKAYVNMLKRRGFHLDKSP